MKKRQRIMYCLYIPALLMLCFFVIRPFFSTLYTSFCKWNGYSSTGSKGGRTFIGLKNYTELLSLSDKRFNQAFLNTLVYAFVSTFFQNILGLSFAMFVNSRFKGNSIVRVLVYMPIMVAGLIMGYIMFFFVQYDRGVLNQILSWFGADPVNWLQDGKRAVILILIINSWQYCGNCMVLYLAGMQGISSSYKEAALMDGAGSWQMFRYIILPLIVPAMMTAVLTNLIGGLKIFDIIVSFTAGGPNYKTHSLMTYLSIQYFDKERAGYAAAIGMLTFAFIMLVSLIVNRFFRSRLVEG